jgi:hypothetical protein
MTRTVRWADRIRVCKISAPPMLLPPQQQQTARPGQSSQLAHRPLQIGDAEICKFQHNRNLGILIRVKFESPSIGLVH